MDVKIITSTQPRFFTGHKAEMSMTRDTTGILWKNFMPLQKAIQGKASSDLFSIQEYSSDYFEKFSPDKRFVKWAAVEVKKSEESYPGLEQITVPEGMYAVFEHYGPLSETANTLIHFFNVWLPENNYRVDQRPHFAVMDERYKPMEDDSMETFWIPVVEPIKSVR